LAPAIEGIGRFTQIRGVMMETNDGKDIRVQILTVNDEAGAAGRRALAVAQQCRRDIAEVGRGQGAIALLVCPAAEEFTDEGIDLVIGVRFGYEIEEDAVFWRQRSLADEIHDKLKVHALVLDLDLSLDGYVKSIEPMLATPYRDELGMLGAVVPPGV
jgi:hypothetical protein